MNSISFRAGKFSVKQITRIALLSALLVAVQVALAAIPNCELVSTLIVLYTLSLGWETLWIVWIFSLVEGLIYGFGMWILGYLYVWPVLVILVMVFKKIIKEDFFWWAVLNGLFGLLFGALFALGYVVIDKSYALTYWIKGIPWDCFHAITNFLLMLLTGKTLNKVLKKCVAADEAAVVDIAGHEEIINSDTLVNEEFENSDVVNDQSNNSVVMSEE